MDTGNRAEAKGKKARQKGEQRVPGRGVAALKRPAGLSEKACGRLQVLAAALCFSISGACVKAIPWTPLAINGARSLAALPVMAGWFLLRGRRLRGGWAVAVGALCLCLTNLCYVFSARLTTAANAIVLQYTSPLFVVGLLAVGYGRRPRGRELAACGAVVGGVLLVFADGLQGGSLAGQLLGLAAGFFYAGVFTAGLLPGADAPSSFLLAQLVGAALGLPFLLAEGSYPPQAVGAAVLMGVFQIGLGFLLLAAGMARTGAVEANLICAAEPVLNPLLAALAWGERPGPAALAGAGLVLAGVVGWQLSGAAGAAGRGRGRPGG